MEAEVLEIYGSWGLRGGGVGGGGEDVGPRAGQGGVRFCRFRRGGGWLWWWRVGLPKHEGSQKQKHSENCVVTDGSQKPRLNMGKKRGVVVVCWCWNVIDGGTTLGWSTLGWSC